MSSRDEVFTHLFFHPEVKSHPCVFEMVFTCEILSWDVTRPGMKSPVSMVKYLHVFAGLKFHPGMKKIKKGV